MPATSQRVIPRARSTIVALGLLLAACSGSSPAPAADVPDAASAFEIAIRAEGGVPILTSDAEVLGEPTIVSSHFDEPDDAIWRLLARSDRPEVPIVVVEIQPNGQFDDSVATTQLFDGRPAVVEEFDSGMTRLTFAGAEGQWVQASSFELEELSLMGFTSPLDVRGDGVDVSSGEWIEVGKVDLPLYVNGHQTLFNAAKLPGVQVEIISSRLTGDLDVWYEWAPAERVDDPRFEWAFRQRNEDVGVDRFIALWDDDVVVEISNVADDDVLAQIIDGLREMRPGESELVPPDPNDANDS